MYRSSGHHPTLPPHPAALCSSSSSSASEMIAQLPPRNKMKWFNHYTGRRHHHHLHNNNDRYDDCSKGVERQEITSATMKHHHHLMINPIITRNKTRTKTNDDNTTTTNTSSMPFGFTLMAIIHYLILALILTSHPVYARRSVASNFSISPPNRARIQYKTTYACEHRELQLKCEPNESIHLVRANYGRFSLSICNDGGRLDLSVMCMSYRSFLIMTDRCSNKSSCSVIVSSKLFDDPCPGTAKYLEVQYHCVQGAASSETSALSSSSASSTRRPHMDNIPLLNSSSSIPNPIGSAAAVPAMNVPAPTTVSPPLESGQQDNSNNKNVDNTIMSSGSSLNRFKWNQTDQSSMDNLPLTLAPLSPFNSPDLSAGSTDQQQSPNIFPKPQENSLDPNVFVDSVEDFCPSSFVRSLFWNSIRKDEMTSQKCPGGATGFVKWRCIFNPDLGIAEWYPPRPDFSECRSLWLDNLEERLNNREPVIKIASELALMTLTKPLYSEDLVKIARIIHKFLEHAVTSIQSLQTVEVWHRHQVLKELLMFIVEIISNLLGNGQDDAWLDLNIANRKEVASSLIKSLENSALLLADNTNHDGSTAIAKPNVLVSVHVLDTRIPISLQFPTYEDTTGTSDWARMEDSIFLPAQSLVDHSQGGLAKVSFFAYYRIEDLLKPSPQTDFERFNSNMARQMQQNLSQNSLSINSHVIGAALSYDGGASGEHDHHHHHHQPIPLSQPVTIILRHIQVENISSPQCVYWNIEHQNWFTDGCWVESTNATHTVCMCNHLTHFALLSEIKTSQDPTVANMNIGRTFVWVSCTLSFVLLAMMTILIFLTPVGNKISASNHRNLYITLLASEFIYIIVINLFDNPTMFAVCLAILHYLLLTTFFWTFFESFDIYMNVNLIYEHFKSSKRLWWYYTFAYLSPLIIVIVCLAPVPSYYSEFSQLSLSNNYVYLTFIGPFIGLILASIVFVLFAYVIIRNHTISATTIKCFEDIRVGGSKSLIVWILLLTLSQTICWSLAFAYLFMPDSQIISIAFAIFNLWLAIFLGLFCILKTENIQHSLLFRYLPFSLCHHDHHHPHHHHHHHHQHQRSHLSTSTKNSTTSDVYSTRPVVTQVTSTQVNGINVHHTPIGGGVGIASGHSPSSPTAISPVSMSPCVTQIPSLPISHSTQWNCQQQHATEMFHNNMDSSKNFSKQDHQSILVQQGLNTLLYNYKNLDQTPLSPLGMQTEQEQQSMMDFNPKLMQNNLSLRRKSKPNPNADFLHQTMHHQLRRAQQIPQMQQMYPYPNMVPNIDHIYESIDSDSLASATLNEYTRRLQQLGGNLYSPNYLSKSTVNEDDLSTSSVYEDKPLLFTNNNNSNHVNVNSCLIDNIKSKRIFLPQHYHSNASIYEKGPPKDNPMMVNSGMDQQAQQSQPQHGHSNLLWNLTKDSAACLPDLLQKSSNLLVSYSDENKIQNKVIINAVAGSASAAAGSAASTNPSPFSK